MNRRTERTMDPSSWPAFDTSALSKQHRKVFVARRMAIELYLNNVALTAIEADTGVVRCQLCRLFDHCVAPHDDGRCWRRPKTEPLMRTVPI